MILDALAVLNYRDPQTIALSFLSGAAILRIMWMGYTEIYRDMQPERTRKKRVKGGRRYPKQRYKPGGFAPFDHLKTT
ncbi:hypothetical protein SAMN05428988_1339 [Chitinophaga sp. YR573]|nr:hypothetical protein SAMN05428988_1339 [Chitinophaga sp. YR573]